VSPGSVRTYAVALAAAATLLAGCGDGGDRPDADSSPTASTSPGASASQSPTVEPATGKLLQNSHFTTRAPAGWRVKSGMTTSVVSTVYAGDEEKDGTVSAFMSIADGPALLDESLDKLARAKVRSDFVQKPAVDTLEVDGVEMYRVAGNVDGSTYAIAIGTIDDEKLVELRLESSVRSLEELQEVLDSVLAAWKWA
jgi:hypothetical protein